MRAHEPHEGHEECLEVVRRIAAGEWSDEDRFRTPPPPAPYGSVLCGAMDYCGFYGFYTYRTEIRTLDRRGLGFWCSACGKAGKYGCYKPKSRP